MERTVFNNGFICNNWDSNFYLELENVLRQIIWNLYLFNKPQPTDNQKSDIVQ
jgi:hypothetical protein